MLIAETDHRLIDDQVAQKGGRYACPACKEPVRLRHGQRIPPYFAHLPHSQCQIASEHESRQHMQGKRQLASFFSAWGPVRLEEVLPAIQQRADVWVTHGQRPLALEFQCSPINDTQVLLRTQGYARLGVAMGWLLGKRYDQQGLSLGLIQRFAAVRGQWGLCLLFWDVGRQQLRVVHHLYQDVLGHCWGTTAWITRLDQFVQGRPRMTPPARPNWPQFRRQLQQRLWRSDARLRPLQEELYLRGQNLATFPQMLMSDQATWPLFGQGEVYWRILMISRLFSETELITPDRVLELGQAVFDQTGGHMAGAGFTCPDVIGHAIRDLLRVAVNHGYLVPGSGGWRVAKQPTWSAGVA